MYLKVKRVIDFVLSLIGLIVLSPVFLILIIAIKLDSKGPVLFKQRRVGIHKSYFNMLKFRTMKIDTPKDTPTHLLENPEQYITKVGKFLRKTSLDELPQLINIISGSMSVIGPRPSLWNQYDLIAERDKYGANDVPVGLTGWAQINGRDELPIEVKAKLDGEYVDRIGLMMDVKCFFETIVSIVKSDGVVEGGTVIISKSKASDKMKRIWIINQYNMPPEYGHLNRHYNFGKYLNRLGHEPSVFVGSFLHNTNIQMIEDDSFCKKYENCEYPYFFVKTCDYSKSKFKRVYAMFEFYYNLIKATKNMEKPDIVLGSSAHPLAAVAAIKLAKKYRCQSIVEVRDLWPESFIAYNIVKRSNPILKLFYAGERWIYKNAGKIIFTMEGGKDYIVEKGWNKENGGPIDLNKVHHINNGVDLEIFNIDKENYVFEDEHLDNDETFKVIYAGSIRLVNNVKSIIDAAYVINKMQSNNIKFLIYGNGSDREYLEEYCTENKINNVVFKGFVDKKRIPYILSKSDLNIIHFEQNDIKKFGASLNKMFEYFASGKPTVSDCEFRYDLIKKYKCGIVVDNANDRQLADAIVQFSKMPYEEYNEFCKNAIKAAHDYDFKILTKKLEKFILKRSHKNDY